jgi:hypothetical protein
VASVFVVGILGLHPAQAADRDDTARIDSPADGATVSGVVEIRGRAVADPPEAFNFYRLYFGPGRGPSMLRPFGEPYTTPVGDGILAVAETWRVPSGDYYLLVRVFDMYGGTSEASIQVTVASQTLPVPSSPTTAGSQPATGPSVDQPQQLVPVPLPAFPQQPAPGSAPAP